MAVSLEKDFNVLPLASLSMTEKNINLHNAERSAGNEDLKRFYDTWAENYEQDSFKFGYHRVLAMMSGMVGRHLDPISGTRILDAGCGTGLMGEVLSLMGFGDLTGIDLSDGMMAVAQQKDVYLSLDNLKIDEAMDLPDDDFDAVVSMGVFTAGCHMPSRSFRELVRITRPGGKIIFGIRIEIPEYPGFSAMFEELEREGSWRHLESTESFQSLPLEVPEALVEVKVFSVCC